MSAIAETIVEPTEEDYNNIDKEFLISKLRNLQATETNDAKQFYKTYTTWSSLSTDQRNKAIKFWTNNVRPHIRRQILEESRNHAVVETDIENERQRQTNKHDQCRLLHLFVDPTASADWTKARQAKTRLELDARNSVENVDPWNNLAEKFNDYQTNRYINATIVPGQSNAAVGTSYLAVEGMERLATFTNELNPTSGDRPLRDGGWIRDQWKN